MLVYANKIYLTTMQSFLFIKGQIMTLRNRELKNNESSTASILQAILKEMKQINKNLKDGSKEVEKLTERVNNLEMEKNAETEKRIAAEKRLEEERRYAEIFKPQRATFTPLPKTENTNHNSSKEPCEARKITSHPMNWK